MNLSEKDKKYIWHPFTQHQTQNDAIPIVSGKGTILYGENGKSYIDAISSWWTNLFGHANPVIANRIKEQVDQLEHVIFAGFTHKPAVDLAEKLLIILPSNQQKVFFSDNGSTCVEVALKMAIQYWFNKGIEKNTVIAFKNAYHGDTFGAMSVGSRGSFNQPFESLLFDVKFIETPTTENLERILEDFQQIITTNNVAAFIFEPLVQGSAGMLMYEAKGLDCLIEIAQKNDICCIADEVFTGFGRTGKTFASDYLVNNPDIFCLSKGITGGFLPLGVTTCSPSIYDAFLSAEKLKTFFHGHSYTGNPIACAAACASLDLLKEADDLIEQLVLWQKEFSMQLEKHPKLENVRRLGTIVAFDLKSNGNVSYFHESRDMLYANFIERGVLLRPLGNTVYVLPPYIMSKAQITLVYNVILDVLELMD